MFGFGGLNTAPSGGFMSRMMGGLKNMRQNIPGAINALGSAMPGAAGEASRISGGLMKNRPGMMPRMAAPGGVPAYGGGGEGDQGPNQQMMPPQVGGLVRMPSFMPQFGGFGMGDRGGGYGTGMPPNPGMPMPQTGFSFDPQARSGNTGFAGGGLFNAYRNQMQEQGAPGGRQLFY